MLKHELLKLKTIMEHKIEFYIAHNVNISDLLEDYKKLNNLILSL